MIKKLLLTLLVVTLSVTAGVAGTLAYLQDEDSDVNVMTVGNVHIKQHEYERVTDANGNYTTIDVDGVKSYELQEFTQGKPLYPFVGEVNNGYDSTPVRLGQLGHNSRGGMDVFPAKNVQDKFVVVENTGSSDAYVRTIVAFEAGSLAEEEWYKVVKYSAHFTWEETQDWFVTEINGNNYYLVEFVYNGYQDVQHPNGVLTPGDFTYNSLAQVYMFDTATNEDVEALDGNKNGLFDILVLSQAVQTAGFANAKAALDEAFGEFNPANVAVWFADEEVPFYADVDYVAEDALAALENGTNIYVDKAVDIINFDDAEIDGKGATVTIDGDGQNAYGYLAFAPGKGENTNVSNINVTGSGFVEVGHYGEGGGTYTVSNLVITALESTLAVNNGSHKVTAAFAHYGTATLTNCKMTGTTSSKEGYNVYDLGAVNGTKTIIDGGEYGSMYIWNQAHVTITNAKVDVIDSAAITTKNLGKLTIGAGAVVGTINLVPGGYTPALVIEDGATVGKIVYNGNTYTVAEWLAR